MIQVNILVLTFYFEPDLCAGSFRNTALVGQLAARMARSDTLDVITTLPNRYSSFSVGALEREERPPISVQRIRLPLHEGGMLDQSRAFIHYAQGVMRAVNGRHYDVVYASSSRLMTAALGARIANACNAPLYLDIRDIFTETMSDMLRGSVARSIIPLLRIIERYTIRTAARVNLAIPAFLSHFKAIDENKEYRQFTNGIDEEFISYRFDTGVPRSGPVTVLYAGNIGEGQGLHLIVPTAARLLGPEYEFIIIGDGGRREQLERAVAGIPNVTLKNPVPRHELLRCYRDADILFMHLNDYPVFRNAIPSKLFEYAATGKPILAGVIGQTAEFVSREITNAVTFSPCNAESLVDAIRRLNIKIQRRDVFIQRFRRDRIMGEMADDIIDLARH